MAYVHKIINDDEKLIGIAHLHWIYIIRGLAWFGTFAAGGWLFDLGLTRLLGALSRSVDNLYVPASALALSSTIMMGCLAMGFMVFLWFVVRVMSDYVALLDHRVIYKTGMFFVNIQEVDLEEIRAEHMDLGMFGRLLGYGSLLLDCRFIGDVRLPQIEHPERFLRALHHHRTEAQSALNLIVGKSNIPTAVNVVGAPASGDQQPEVQPPKPEPEITPPQPDQIPVPPNQPMPDAPPPLDEKKEAATKTLPQKIMHTLESVAPHSDRDEIKAPASLEQVRAHEVQHPAQDLPQQQRAQVPQPEQQIQPPQPQPAPAQLDPAAIAKVIEQATPQIAQQVMKEMSEQGLIKTPDAAQNDNDVDNDLIHVFDEATLKKDAPHDTDDKLEYAIN